MRICAQNQINQVDFFATAKTHKFDSVNDTTLDKLKLRPIMDQTGTYIYNASKVVAKYLRPLSKNKYSIDDTLTFPDLLKNAEESDDYEDVSYNVKNLFTLAFQLKKRSTL